MVFENIFNTVQKVYASGTPFKSGDDSLLL